MFLYRDSALRRDALDAPLGNPSRYSLYGADVLAERGHRVAWRIANSGPERRRYHWPGYVCDRALKTLGWPGGLFASALAMLSDIRRSSVVVSTVDSIGIPLLWFRRIGLFSAPLIYISVGFPERLAALSDRFRRLYARLLRQASAVVAFGFQEAEQLRALMGSRFAHRVHFVPFGAHDAFLRRYSAEQIDPVDVLSIGADLQRDFALLLKIAARRPEWSFELIAGADQAKNIEHLPSNLRLLRDIPLAEVRDRMMAARLIALPVRENSYSGATTTLLQAMALGCPVVVSRVGAIREGYGFNDGEHLRWVEPGDAAAFEEALAELLADEKRRRAIGTSAARHVAREHSWTRFVDRLEDVINTVLQERRAA